MNTLVVFTPQNEELLDKCVVLCADNNMLACSFVTSPRTCLHSTTEIYIFIGAQRVMKREWYTRGNHRARRHSIARSATKVQPHRLNLNLHSKKIVIFVSLRTPARWRYYACLYLLCWCASASSLGNDDYMENIIEWSDIPLRTLYN